MREILFRGKRLDNGEWVTGCLVKYAYDSTPYIGYLDAWGDGIYEVDPSTVGQFTGLTANGKKIFEGDIVRPKDYKSNRVYEIVWNDLFTGYWYFRNDTFYSMLTERCEVIGNVHDSPELLEGKG